MDRDATGELRPDAAVLCHDERAAELRRAEHWSRIASSLARPFSARAASCADEAGHVTMLCTTCGLVHAFRTGCKCRAFCTGCARAWGRARTKQVSAGIEGMHAAQRRAWLAHGSPRGLEPSIVLLTFTVQHTGNLEKDIETQRAAWPKWRAWLRTYVRAAWARALGCRRGEVPVEVARTPFALAWEATNGDDQLGHGHAHAAIVLPFVGIQHASAMWEKHCERPAHIKLSRDKRTGRVLRARTGKDAARYLAKYVSKGVFSADLSTENAAAWVRATYSRRTLQASLGLLALGRERPTCGGGVDDAGCGAPIDVVAWQRAPLVTRGPPNRIDNPATPVAHSV